MEFINYKKLFFDEAEADNTDSNTDNQPDANKAPANNNDQKPGGKSDNDGKDDARNEKKYSDADLDKIIENKFAKWQKQQAKAVDEAKKLANMTAQERVEHERDKLKAELDALKKANAVAEMEKTARGILQNDGVNIPDVIISSLVADDAEATSANVKAFSKAFKAAVQAEVKAQLSHKSPSTGATGKAMTKEEINKITDPVKRQEAIRNNMNLYRH